MSDINALIGRSKDAEFHLVVNHWINRRCTRASDHAGKRPDGDYCYDSPGHSRLRHRRPRELGHLGSRHQGISAGRSPAFDTRRHPRALDLSDDEEPQYRLSKLELVPELPDIVVYIEALEKRIQGSILERVRIASPFLLRTAVPPLSSVEGKKIVELSRLGKRICFGLEGDLWLVLHLMI